jgi:hypothetical protein
MEDQCHYLSGTLRAEMGVTDLSSDAYQRALRAYDDGGAIAIEDMRDILRAMMGKDAAIGEVNVLEGHNALAFDIDKMMQTMSAQETYITQSTPAARELRTLWEDLRNRRFGSVGVRDYNFAQDTLDSVKFSMQVQRKLIAEQIQEALSGAENLPTELSQRAEVVSEVTHHLLGEFSISPQLASSRPDSLENIFLNTNFFELLEEMAGKDPDRIAPIFEALQKGGEHTADVDAILTAYVSEFINNDALKIRRFPTAGQSFDSLSPEAAALLKEKSLDIESRLQASGHVRKAGEKYSKFAEYMRATIAKSSSVTPTTNVADVKGLSDEMFDYLSSNPEGRRRIKIAATLDDLDNLSVELSPHERAALTAAHQDGSAIGTIQYRKASGQAGDVGGYFFKSDTSDFTRQIAATGSPEESSVGNLIETKMRTAKSASGTKLDMINAEGKTIGTIANANQASNDIVDIGIRNIEQTQFNQRLSNLKKIETLKTSVDPITAENIAERASITSRAYGIPEAHLPSTDSGLAQRGIALGRVLVNSKAEEYGEAVIRGGLGYADLDYSSRVIGVGTSRATARTLAQASTMAGSSISTTVRNIGRGFWRSS